MKTQFISNSQRRALRVQSKSSVYRGEVPFEKGVTAATPVVEEPPPAQQLTGTLTETELEGFKSWLLAVILDSIGNTDLAGGHLAANEIRLTPKASSAGAEGTMFYDSDDDHVYVATE